MAKLFNSEEVRPSTPSPPSPSADGLKKTPTRASNISGSCSRPSAFSFLLSAFRCLVPTFRFLPFAFCLLLSAFCLLPAQAQVESVESAVPTHYLWLSHGRIEGHLALSYSPAGAFSPDGSILAVASENKIVLMGVREGSMQKVLKPRIPNITDLNIQSANFLAMNQLLLLGSGAIAAKDKGAGRSTPLLAFQWDTIEDQLSGKVDEVGGGGGFGPILYFPRIGCLVLYKASNFDFWDPRSGRMARLTIPDLTQSPNVFAVSPDGHWILLAQIAMSSTPDPVVVRAKEHRLTAAKWQPPAKMAKFEFSQHPNGSC